MFIESVRNLNSPPCILLRETYRLDGKVRHRTIANLAKWPANFVQGLQKNGEQTVLQCKRAIYNVEASAGLMNLDPGSGFPCVLVCVRKAIA